MPPSSPQPGNPSVLLDWPSQELTLEFPNVVNPRKNTELRYTTDPVMPALLAKAN